METVKITEAWIIGSGHATETTYREPQAVVAGYRNNLEPDAGFMNRLD